MNDANIVPIKVAVVVGTRPEAIKMAPVILALAKDHEFVPILIATGQHGEMLSQALDLFNLTPDHNLQVMQPGQSLAELTAKIVAGVSSLLDELKPDVVLVHGDTTTAFASSLAAFYLGVPVGHVEAGLRTRNILGPFPEEFNRQAIARLATWNFAPTSNASANLVAELVAPESIHVTGNTIVDALNMVIQQLNNDGELGGQVKRELLDILKLDYEARPLVLVTAHRRENLGGGIESICEAVADLAELFPSVNFVFPVHLNPVVRELAEKHLSGKENVTLTRPLNYLEFLTLLSRCSLAISDSGGVQEEGVSLNKRILVTREETERAEGVKSGHLTLVGANRKVIVEEASSVLTAFERSEPFSGLENPYGDGSAAARILGVLAAHGK